MLLAQVEGFLAIVRHGNLSRAATDLYLTQPALTARLHALEEELGTPLFTRSARGMRLTDAGRAYEPYAERAVGLLGEARQAVRNLHDGVTGELLIGAAPAVSTYVLPAVLKAFRSTHPSVRLSVRTGHSEEVLEMVLREEVRVGLGRPIRHQDIETIPLYEDEVVLVVGARHPFAAKRRIPMEDLSKELLILFDRTSSYHELTSALFRQAGVVPAGTMELDNAEAAKKMVQLELGVALLPRTAVAEELISKTLHSVQVVGAAPVRRPIVAMRRRDSGKASGPAAWFLATLEELRAKGTLDGTRRRSTRS